MIDARSSAAVRITELDLLRLDKPRKVNRLLEELIPEVPLEDLPAALLVYGATFRQLDQLDDARWAYFAASEFTTDSEGEAYILQKLAWVEAADGDFPTAIKQLRQASGIFTELAAWTQVGKILADQALIFRHWGKCSAALRCANSALSRLDDEEYRFSALQVQAYCYKLAGETEKCVHSLGEAQVVAGRCSKAARVRFVWFNAYLKREVLAPLDAASAFAEAATFFGDSGEVLSEILATLEYAECQLKAGNLKVVTNVAVALKRFAFRETGSLVEDAIMNIYRAGLKGLVSREVIRETINAVHQAVAAVGKPTAASWAASWATPPVRETDQS